MRQTITDANGIGHQADIPVNSIDASHQFNEMNNHIQVELEPAASTFLLPEIGQEDQ